MVADAGLFEDLGEPVQGDLPPTDEPAKLLDVITPGGFEGYFAGLGELFRANPIPDMEALGRLAAEYGLDVDPMSVPRPAEAHQLRLG